MKKINLSLIIFIFSINFIFSQTMNCDCLNVLDNTSELIKEAKSYKIQIKRNDREAEFNNWKNKVKREIEKDSLSQYFCSGYLQKYISFINDRHNQIYLAFNNISSNVPNYSKTIDTHQNTKDEISGVYYAGKDKILVKKENDSVWFGLTLKSDSDKWTKGKIRLKLKKTSKNKFEIFEYYKNGTLFYQKNIQIANGRIHSTFWNKEDKYFFNKNMEDYFIYKSLNSSFDYIGIKTLSRTNKLIKKADDFYEKTLTKLKKDNLIIDLRNNGGGAIKQIKPLIKSLKRNKAIKKIYVLINFKTASAAELATLKLKEDKRTILVGENSRGMLAYGYGNNAFSPISKCSLKTVLSTKYKGKKLSQYEYIGIEPDYLLNNKSDWIKQITKLKTK